MTHTQDFFHQLKRLNNFLFFGLIIASALAIVLVASNIPGKANEDINRFLQGVAVLISVVTFFIGLQTFKKRVLMLRKSTEAVPLRLAQYRKACFNWWLILFVPGILYIVFFVATGNYAFLVLALFNCVAILLFRQRKENVQILLNLSEKQLS